MRLGYLEPKGNSDADPLVHLVVSESVALADPVRPTGPWLGEELARFRPALLALARRITRDEDASADIVQRTFLKVLVHIDQYEGRAALRTWVWRIAANEALLWGREKMRRERQQAVVAACASWGEDAPSPLEVLERRRTVDRVRRALEALPPRDRALIEDTLTVDRSTIARLSGRAGVCARTLRTRLYRARRRLRGLFEEEP